MVFVVFVVFSGFFVLDAFCRFSRFCYGFSSFGFLSFVLGKVFWGILKNLETTIESP